MTNIMSLIRIQVPPLRTTVATAWRLRQLAARTPVLPQLGGSTIQWSVATHYLENAPPTPAANRAQRTDFRTRWGDDSDEEM